MKTDFDTTNLGAYGLGARIAAIRKKKGWTQADLAERMHVSVQAVSKWETGASWPDVTTLPRLATLLGVSLDWLFGMDPETPDPEQVLETPEEKADVTAASDTGEGAGTAASDDAHDETSTKGPDDETSTMGPDVETSTDRPDKEASTGGPDSEETERKVSEASADLTTFGDANIYILPGDDRDWGWEYTGEGAPPYTIEIHHGHIRVLEDDRDQDMIGNVRRFFNKNTAALKLYCPTALIEDLSINAKGMSNIFVDVPARRADLQLKGAGGIQAKAVDHLKLSLTGVGNCKIGDLDTGTIEVPGVGSLEVARVTGRIDVTQRGVGSIKLKRGYLENLTVRSSGVGSLYAEDVEVIEADIVVKGVGDVRLGKVHKISLEQGHVGSVKYKLV